MSTLNNFKHIITNMPLQFETYEITIFDNPKSVKNHLFYLIAGDEVSALFPCYFNFNAFNSYLILYTLSGEGKFTNAHTSYLLPPHSVAFIDCHSPFQLEMNKCSTWHYRYFLIEGNELPFYFETFHNKGYEVCVLNPLSRFPATSQSLLEYLSTPNKENYFIISKLITDLLTQLIVAKETECTMPLIFPKYLFQIKETFDEHYSEHFTLEELADTYHISKYKIIRDFKTYLNMSPINYLIARRMEAAQELLRTTEYPIYEIASMVGIDNINHFTNLFKKATNMTPICYRKFYHSAEENCLIESL